MALGELERAVMGQLWAAPGPLTVREVHDRLERELAYTTVMTVLARLNDKGLVTRARAGRAYAYALVPDEAEVTAHRMRRLLDAGGNRARVLSRFVETLSADDEALLAELLHRPEPEEQR